jgi:soluble lytic murein transglycosylase-like protein
MAALRMILAATALVIAVPARADPIDLWRSSIAQASVRFGVPEGWIIRVMRIESGGKTLRNGHPITSRAGAMGLMQLMPATWERMHTMLGLGSNPHDPRDNIIAGTAYLRMMYDRFGYPGLFGAYNAGPGRYGDYLAGRSRLPAETTAYLASAMARAGPARQPNIASNQVASFTPTRRPDHLFFAMRTPQIASAGIAIAPAQAGLFVRLSTTSGTQ